MIKDIGNTLKECRSRAKISVKEISDLLTNKGYKASESTIYSWENGNSQPTPGALLTMCQAYGIDDVLSTFGYNGYKEDGSLQLNLNEIDQIEKYRLLDPHGKEMTDLVLNKEYDRCQAIQQEKVISLDKNPTFEHPVPTAAHADDYIHASDDLKQLEEDIMDDENF